MYTEVMRAPHVVLAVLLTCAPAAFAQGFEASVSGGESYIPSKSSDIGSGFTLKDGFKLTLRMTLNWKRFLGHEFGYGYNHTSIDIPASTSTLPGQGTVTTPAQNSSLPGHQGFYDLLAYATPEGSHVRPFACGGVQFTSFSDRKTRSLPRRRTAASRGTRASTIFWRTPRPKARTFARSLAAACSSLRFPIGRPGHYPGAEQQPPGAPGLLRSSGVRHARRLARSPVRLRRRAVHFVFRSEDPVTTPAQNSSLPGHQGFYDLLAYATPEGSHVRPFACGGVQFTSFSQSGSYSRETKYGVNYGGGIKGRGKEDWGLRLDIRQYNMGKPFHDVLNSSGRLQLYEFGVGISFMM